jgi:hypothetical protein
MKAVYDIRTKLDPTLDMLVEGDELNYLKANSLNVLLQSASDEIVEPSEKPGPNGSEFIINSLDNSIV